MKINSAQELPDDFGKINGQLHPDTIAANISWNRAVEASAAAAESEISQFSHSEMQDQWNEACRHVARRIRSLSIG